MQNSTGVVLATGYIRRMRGGAQAHLLRCSDGQDYVVKFRNNPQGVRVLANEYIFSNLAKSLGFTVANHKLVQVDASFIRSNPSLNIWVPGDRFLPCEAGLQFGSRTVNGPFAGLTQGLTFSIPSTRNSSEFVGMLLLDKWVCNRDNRQAIFSKGFRQRKYTVTFIDHGYCFGGPDWDFSDRWPNGSFQGYRTSGVYKDVTDWQSFQPWLSQLESLSPDVIWSAAENTPPEWYRDDWGSLEYMCQKLIDRRRFIRELIEDFRYSGGNPFKNWRNSQVA